MRRQRILGIAALLVVIAGIGMVVEAVEAIEMKYTPEQKFLFDTIKNRRSVRAFNPTPVHREHILQILDMARMAPTSGNQQPWKFLVVQDKSKIEAMRKACVNRSLARLKMNVSLSADDVKKRTERIENYFKKCFSAPAYIVVLVDMQSKYPTYNRHDGPLAAGYLMLAARALGYGTVFYTDSIPSAVSKEVLTIPDRYERICITPLGVPETWPKGPEKKELKDFIVFEKF